MEIVGNYKSNSLENRKCKACSRTSKKENLEHGFSKSFTTADENEWKSGSHIVDILEYRSKKLLFNFLCNKETLQVFIMKRSLCDDSHALGRLL